MLTISTQSKVTHRAEEQLPSRAEDTLVGLLDARHQENALEIWKNLIGLPRLTQFELAQRTRVIHTAATRIMDCETNEPTPFSHKDRRELAQLFRNAASALVFCSSSLDDAVESGSPLLVYARQLEATFT